MYKSKLTSLGIMTNFFEFYYPNLQQMTLNICRQPHSTISANKSKKILTSNFSQKSYSKFKLTSLSLINHDELS